MFNVKSHYNSFGRNVFRTPHALGQLIDTIGMRVWPKFPANCLAFKLRLFHVSVNISMVTSVRLLIKLIRFHNGGKNNEYTSLNWILLKVC